MKHCTLQWRLTLLTAALMAGACLLLNLLLGFSAVAQMDGMENYILKIVPEGQDTLVVDLSPLDFYPDLANQLNRAKSVFRSQSIAATLGVILAGGAVTYFLAGRALKPLRQFSRHIEQVQVQNLSEPLPMPPVQDELARLTHTFNEMLVRLDQAFSAQRQFSANAAHELRTPLAVLQTKLEVFQKRAAPTPQEYAETLSMVAVQTDRLSHLVSVLLELTELGTLQRTDPVSLAALTEEVLCDLAQVAQEREVTLLQTKGDATLTGSDLLLYRAIYNLVENAIKYNRPGGTVTVAVRAEEHRALLQVTDTGIGIAPEHWQVIFDPFVRVDKSRSRAMGGAGLGLALVRDIAQAHGGTVGVIKSSPQGTEIQLSLPR